jgi:hypothetical protein
MGGPVQEPLMKKATSTTDKID